MEKEFIQTTDAAEIDVTPEMVVGAVEAFFAVDERYHSIDEQMEAAIRTAFKLAAAANRGSVRTP